MFDVNDFIENLRNGELWIAYLLLFVPIIYLALKKITTESTTSLLSINDSMDLNYITKDKLERLKPVILKFQTS